MSVTNDPVYSLIQPYFSLCPVHYLSDSSFNFADVSEEAPSGGENFGCAFIFPFIITYNIHLTQENLPLPPPQLGEKV